MSYSLTTLRTALRGLLLDQVAPYAWPDALLTQALQEAVVAHSYLFPQEVRLSYTTTDGQTAQVLYAVNSFASATSGGLAQANPSPGAASLISVQRVELPAGTAIPQDPGQIEGLLSTVANAYKQAWRWRGDWLYFRNALSGPEVGANLLLVELLQTYALPDSSDTILWNGPAADLSFLYLLAQRSAYQALSGLQSRDGESSQNKWNIAGILASLEGEIDRAITVRQRRAVRSRTLDI